MAKSLCGFELGTLGNPWRALKINLFTPSSLTHYYGQRLLPTAEQVQRAKLTPAKSSLSAKKGKRVKKLTKKAEQVEAAAVGKLAEKAGKENKKAKDKSERAVSVP